jgi:hypothetical protein
MLKLQLCLVKHQATRTVSSQLQAQAALPSVPTAEETIRRHSGSEHCGEDKSLARAEDQIPNSPLVQLIKLSL